MQHLTSDDDDDDDDNDDDDDDKYNHHHAVWHFFHWSPCLGEIETSGGARERESENTKKSPNKYKCEIEEIQEMASRRLAASCLTDLTSLAVSFQKNEFEKGMLTFYLNLHLFAHKKWGLENPGLASLLHKEIAYSRYHIDM